MFQRPIILFVEFLTLVPPSWLILDQQGDRIHGEVVIIVIT